MTECIHVYLAKQPIVRSLLSCGVRLSVCLSRCISKRPILLSNFFIAWWPHHSTPWAIKACHFVFDNNSGVSWSIFILSVPVETGRNTLQFTNLMAWWRHNCITSHVTKVCFIQLLQVKYDEFEDRPKFFVKNLWECENFSHRRLIKECSTKKIKQISA